MAVGALSGTRRVGVVTTGRSDYGLLRPLIASLINQPAVRVQVFATGMHFSKRFGASISELEKDGHSRRLVRVPALFSGDDAASVAASLGRTTQRFAAALDKHRPDILVVLGDRFETLGVAAATLPFDIALAHIHGGEITEGAMDDAIRHALTKMSHLHFVAAEPYAARLHQMGEEKWRVVVSGAPALDALEGFVPTPARELSSRLRVPIGRQTILLTYHPETRRGARTLADLDAVLAALDTVGAPVLITAPNADPRRDAIAKRLAAFASAPGRVMVANLGQQNYFSVMSHVGVMVGNSSSGLIEAPSFRLPVVNIGDRQFGRLRAANVIDVAPEIRSITRAVHHALQPDFRASLSGLRNPFRKSRAAERIARRLATVELGPRLLRKRFIDHEIADV